MKKYLIGVGIVLVSILIIYFAIRSQTTHMSRTATHDDKQTSITVAASIFPLFDIVRIVAGSDATVLPPILPPGASPHTFEPTPSLIKSLQDTDIIFRIGILDEWTDQFGAQGGNAKVVTVDRDISLEEGNEEEGEAYDPHYWLDPKNAEHIAITVAEELSLLDPIHESAYHDRAVQFGTTLAEHDIAWKKEISELRQKNIVTFHDAFNYFANHFGLEVVTTFEPFPGKEPTPQYLIEIQEEAEAYDIKTLYIEPELSAAAIYQFAKDINASIGVLDPLGGIENRMSYIDLIDFNIRTIIDTQGS